MKYNIIGDIHGRKEWKNLVNPEDINIFLGDYFDPYDNIEFDDLKSNFLDIIDFKINYPNNVILLYGNHDYHYIVDNINEQYSRYDYINATQIKEIFNEFEDLFYGVCYTFNKYICTHAGITENWYIKYFETKDYSSLKEVEDNINNLWKTDKQAFSFYANAKMFDTYGTSPEQSPLWVRPQTLLPYNMFYDEEEYKATGKGPTAIQLVGHTRPSVKEPLNLSNVGVILCDVLENNKIFQLDL